VTVALVAAAALQGCASSRSRAEVVVPSGWPVDPEVAVVSSPFGARRHGSWHTGLDLRAPKGTPVWATADGTVVVAEREGAYGRTVVVDHGSGYTTRYAHLRRIKVERGERVQRGEVLGTVGESGNADGVHLHYEVLRDGRPVDPRPYLGGG
jgi:murein DD-endopeptidase MepM/ murein hydrolase activator NlpD